MRKCQYCKDIELCGIGKENIPVCETHFEDYLKGKRREIDRVIDLQRAKVEVIK